MANDSVQAFVESVVAAVIDSASEKSAVGIWPGTQVSSQALESTVRQVDTQIRLNLLVGPWGMQVWTPAFQKLG